MFGYIKPDTPNLLVREHEEYKGIYCSLCKALGEHYGLTARLTLSYDCTFLSLLVLGLKPQCSGFSEGKCVCNPFKKCHYYIGATDRLRLPAALSVLSMYQKLRDDLHDAGFFGKLRALALLPLARRPYRKAKKDYPGLAEVLETMMQEQAAAEQAQSDSLDCCAEPTARMLSYVFSLLTEETEEKLVLESIGYYVGKWVYIMDAADDLEEDLKQGSFNPLIYLRDLNGNSSQEELQAAKQYCNQSLNVCVSQIILSGNLLTLSQFDSIVKNIVEKGLPQMQRAQLFDKGEITHD